MSVAGARGILALCCYSLLGVCAGEPASQPVTSRIYAMGTWVDVTLVTEAEHDADRIRALRDVEALLRGYERDFYPWAPGELAKLNASIADGRAFAVSTALARLLERAQSLSRVSDGLFDPGVGGLVELWGFDTAPTRDHEPPSPTAIAETLTASAGIAALRIDGTRVSSSSRGLEIDLGGIAKGAAVGEILALLESRGIASALVNAGGDLMVAGRAGGGRPWRVGIRHPREDGLIGVLELTGGEAAFTSGDYERYFEHRGERLSHLLDPSSGRPVSHTQAVTVLATDPVLADAAATALAIAGPDRWLETAARLGIAAALRVDASGEVQMTPAMETRITSRQARHDIIMGSRQE